MIKDNFLKVQLKKFNGTMKIFMIAIIHLQMNQILALND